MATLRAQPASDLTATRPLNWGVLGAARIARKLIPAFVEEGGHVVAVGASSLERAVTFALEMKVPKALQGYQAVIDLPDVNAIYVPLTNDLHFRWALACARAGKSCLCEKPMVLTGDEARQLRAEFAQTGARLVEGFMWRHNPQTTWVLQQLRDGVVGEIVRIHSEFSFSLDRPADYRWRDNMGGSLWDVGVYCINAMRLFMGEEPCAASARMIPAEGARVADKSTAGWLDFGGGRLGTFQCSFVSARRQTVMIAGTLGTLEICNPFIGKIDKPTKCIVSNESGSHEKIFSPSNSYVNMAAHFRRAIHDPSFALTPAEDGVDQARVMEALAASGKDGGTVKTLKDL